MTNEEKKSNEIAIEYLSGHDRSEVTYEEMREAILEMANWKNQQFNKICNRLRETNIDGLSDSKNLTSYFIKKLREIYNN